MWVTDIVFVSNGNLHESGYFMMDIYAQKKDIEPVNGGKVWERGDKFKVASYSDAINLGEVFEGLKNCHIDCLSKSGAYRIYGLNLKISAFIGSDFTITQ
jgi:hypothetical protein